MWIHFDLICDVWTQKRLYRAFRPKIEEWERAKIIRGAVLTYHPDCRPSLYVCLDIPEVKEPEYHNYELPDEARGQIPTEIMNSIEDICNQELIQYKITDYEFEIQRGYENAREHGCSYYEGAPVNEILRFGSTGTKIALNIIEDIERDRHRWDSDKELADYILYALKGELGQEYHWLGPGLHFVCNSLCPLVQFQNLIQSHINSETDDSCSSIALNLLYQWLEN